MEKEQEVKVSDETSGDGYVSLTLQANCATAQRLRSEIEFCRSEIWR